MSHECDLCEGAGEVTVLDWEAGAGRGTSTVGCPQCISRELREEIRQWSLQHGRVLDEMQELESENQRLRKALEWYAHPVLPYAVTQFNEPRSAVHADGGRRAREALAAGGANE